MLATLHERLCGHSSIQSKRQRLQGKTQPLAARKSMPRGIARTIAHRAARASRVVAAHVVAKVANSLAARSQP
jgi:hypothetical protein